MKANSNKRFSLCVVLALWFAPLFGHGRLQDTVSQVHSVIDYHSGKHRPQTTRLDSLLQSMIDQQQTHCLAAMVLKGDSVVYHKAFGWKDPVKRIPASTNDYYVLFSQTKAVVTAAFMTLVDQGLVNVDDPVSTVFSQIPDRVITKINADGTYESRPAASPMTFAHLMSHSSGLNAGLARQLQSETRKKKQSAVDSLPTGQRTMNGNPGARYLKDEMVDLAAYPLGFDPGTEWNYHVSTNMLAYMVELISGMPLRDYVKKAILDPLEMNDTDWYYSADKLGRFVKVYNYVDGKLEPAPNTYSERTIDPAPTYFEGAIGLNGPIADYAKFCQMLLDKGAYKGKRILKPETVELMTTVNQLPEQNAGGKGFQFGLGFELYNELKKPVPEVSNTAFAWGGMLGTEYLIDPENDMVFLFYLNMFRRPALYPKFLSEAYKIFAY